MRLAGVAASVGILLSLVACGSGNPPALEHLAQGAVVSPSSWGIVILRPVGATISVTIGPYHNVSASDVRIVSVVPNSTGGTPAVVGVDVAGPDRAIGVGGGQHTHAGRARRV